MTKFDALQFETICNSIQKYVVLVYIMRRGQQSKAMVKDAIFMLFITIKHG